MINTDRKYSVELKKESKNEPIVIQTEYKESMTDDNSPIRKPKMSKDIKRLNIKNKDIIIRDTTSIKTESIEPNVVTNSL
jgi:hypothetical protein